MKYDKGTFEAVVSRLGEVFFVLDSGEEFIVHGNEGYDFRDIGGSEYVRVSGIQDDGEFVVAEFPLSAIEHHYTHKEI